MRKFDVSERLACRVLGQHRSTQRKAPKGAPMMRRSPPTSSRWRRSMAAMATAGSPRCCGGRLAVNVKRVERIWRLEGLKVPSKQPRKARLWLNDACVADERPAATQDFSSSDLGQA